MEWRPSDYDVTDMTQLLFQRHKYGAILIMTSKTRGSCYLNVIDLVLPLTLQICITSMSVLFITAS